MDRTDVAIVINTCPKYFYILETMFGLLRRYGSKCKWPVYLVTECWNNEKLLVLCIKYNIKILRIDETESDFLESRVAACKALPDEIKYILPLQDDFFLERPGVDCAGLTDALSILDEDESVSSLRLMPCPGSTSKVIYKGSWNTMRDGDLLFSYQATIWRKTIYKGYLDRLITHCRENYPETTITRAEWNKYTISRNPAETAMGLTLLKSYYPTSIHLCWSRKGTWANAVYDCPWPYRPTAVVQGVLQPWALDLIRREGFQSNVALWN
jgi:hypothetical protein